MQNEIGKAQTRISNVIEELNQIQKSFKEKPKAIEWMENVDEDSNSDQEWEELPDPTPEPESKMGIFEELEMKIGIQVDLQLKEMEDGSNEAINELQKQLQQSLEKFVEVVNGFNVSSIKKGGPNGTSDDDQKVIDSLSN